MFAATYDFKGHPAHEAAQKGAEIGDHRRRHEDRRRKGVSAILERFVVVTALN